MEIGEYKHFKGGIYAVTGVAKFSEDPEKEFVIYEHDGVLWARPKEMFLEDVVVDGKKVPRFKKI
ncbi:MAG TPA: DUF1653 domain-containing protein [Candidatus Paceibacterota bacterium]|nr:DUF1653 domain-containing protein [Candidatus Paceibacterota bacterium]